MTISARELLPSAKFKVKTDAIRNGKCGTTKSNLKSCDSSAGNSSVADSAVAVITFKLKN